MAFSFGCLKNACLATGNLITQRFGPGRGCPGQTSSRIRSIFLTLNTPATNSNRGRSVTPSANAGFSVAARVELQVENGSLHQFFLHCGHRCEEILAALTIVGCDRIAFLIRQAMSTLPPGVFLSEDAQRYEQMWKIGKAAEADLQKLTEEYYALCPGEPYEKMRQYLDKERGLTKRCT
jgi:hypothetical protein